MSVSGIVKRIDGAMSINERAYPLLLPRGLEQVRLGQEDGQRMPHPQPLQQLPHQPQSQLACR